MNLLKVKLVLTVLIVKVFTAEYINYEDDDYSDSFDYFEGDFDDYFPPSQSKKEENTKLKSCEICGLEYGGANKEKVIEGILVDPEYKYPWIIPIINDEDKIYCGGALISATFVLTAGHCLLNKDMIQHSQCLGDDLHLNCFLKPNMFKVGLVKKHPRKAFNSRFKPLAVRKIIPHPKYSFERKQHDVALIRLAKPVHCSKYNLPVCLPHKDFHKIGTKLITVGYGRNVPWGYDGSRRLREGVINELDPGVCRPEEEAKYVVCASGMKTGQSSCKGDSGSALIGKFGRKFYAVGIVNFGSPDCNPKKSGVYAKVYYYMPFIKRYVKDLPH